MVDFLLSILGWIILRLKHNNKQKRQQILNTKYDGDYLAVGLEWSAKIIAIIFMISLFIFLFAIVYATFFR